MKHFNKLSSIKNNYFEKLYSSLFAMVLLLAAIGNVKAQAGAYAFAQSSATFTPITGTVLGTATANSVAGSLHTDIYPLILPFGFTFNDISYNSANVSANGFITFGATVPLGSNVAPISSTVAYDGAISVFGRDINSVFNLGGVTGNISWDVVGTAPNREIVIQWKDFRPTYSTVATAAYTFSFQIRLQETTNAIKFVYSSGSYLLGTTAYESAAQIGLRGMTNADFNNRLNAATLAFVNSTVGIANTSTQSYSTTAATPGMPPAGLTYTWTPPTCYAPAGLTQISTTSNTATISWTANSVAPSSYEIFYSTSNTSPASTVTPQVQNITTASAVIASLLPATTYYVWVRSNCGSGNISAWSPLSISIVTKCQPPALLSTTGATVCPNQAATLSATTTGGGVLKWYDAATAGNVLATSPSYITPSLTATTNYWVSAVSEGSEQFIGKTAPTATTGNTTFVDYGLVFDTYNPMTISQVDVYPAHATNTTGTVTINLKNSAGTIMASQVATVNVSPSGVLNTINLNFDVPTAGTDYRLVVDGATNITSLRREITTGFAYPYILGGLCTITAARFGNAPSASYYYYLYNWKVIPRCESPRVMVTATVDSACLGTSETDKKNGIRVYPNPFSEVINIDTPELVKTIQITDLSGKLIKSGLRPESAIRLNDLSAGIYILQLDLKDGSRQTMKIIKK